MRTRPRSGPRGLGAARAPDGRLAWPWTRMGERGGAGAEASSGASPAGLQLHLPALHEHDLAAVEHDRQPPVRSDRPRRPGPVADTDGDREERCAAPDRPAAPRAHPRPRRRSAARARREPQRAMTPVEQSTRCDPKRRRRQPRLRRQIALLLVDVDPDAATTTEPAASSRIPATLRPSTRTSFGHLTIARGPPSFSIAVATASPVTSDS